MEGCLDFVGLRICVLVGMVWYYGMGIATLNGTFTTLREYFLNQFNVASTCGCGILSSIVQVSTFRHT